MTVRALHRAYHYTCDHGALGIHRDGVITPSRHLWLPKPVAWFTDLDTPLRDALGLTSHILTCDRTTHRFEVDPAGLVWWPHYARKLGSTFRQDLESAPGALPMHWWVSESTVPINQPQAGVS